MRCRLSIATTNNEERSLLIIVVQFFQLCSFSTFMKKGCYCDVVVVVLGFFFVFFSPPFLSGELCKKKQNNYHVHMVNLSLKKRRLKGLNPMQGT